HGPISRASLAKLSRLSKPTVSSQVETLIRRGWVTELGPGRSGSKGGKKPTLLQFNADAGRLFSVEIDADRIRIAVADLEGRILSQADRQLTSDRTAPAVLAAISSELDRVINSESSNGMLRLISVAAPGRVDVRRGVILKAGNVFN